MVLGNLLSAAKRSVVKHLSAHEDRNLHFIKQRTIPELQTIAVAPGELHGDMLKADYSHERRRLRITIEDDPEVIFVFREQDIMVLTEAGFDPEAFRRRLIKAIAATRAATTAAIPRHYPQRG